MGNGEWEQRPITNYQLPITNSPHPHTPTPLHLLFISKVKIAVREVTEVRYNHLNKLEISSIVIAIYPGSFDPITLGHLDLIERGSRLFAMVIVAVLRNPNKTPLFTVEQRLEQIRLSTQHLPNVEVDSFDGLTVQYAQMQGAQVLLRGLRAISDFEVELQMAHTNKTLFTEIETVFLATSNEYSFLSSSVVREVARFGGSVDHLVPPHVALDIYQCYAHNNPVSNPIKTEVFSPLKNLPNNQEV